MKWKVIKTCIATSVTVLMLFPALAQALSLGGMTVTSHLNQPLEAEIALFSANPTELINTTVEIASNEVHKQAGIAMTEAVRNVKFKVIPGPGGQFVIQLTTLRSIREPVLAFIVEANASSGSVRRQYTVHLDPAKF